MQYVARGALALAFLGLFPSAPAAQETPVREVVESQANDRLADSLFDEAAELEADQAAWLEAAELFAKSGDLRDPDDMRAHTAYVRAGNLLYYSAKPEAAREMFTRAGYCAVEAGETYKAALAFSKAVQLVAMHGAEQEDEEEVSELVETLRRLIESPELTEEQRAYLRQQLKP